MTEPPVRRSSTPTTPLEVEAWPKLDDDALGLLRQAGSTREIAHGDVLFDVGQESYDLIYVERGTIGIVDRSDDSVITEISAGDFAGEIGMLMGQRTFLAAVALEPGQVILVPPGPLRELIGAVPEVGDVVVSAFAARRRLLMSWGQGGLVIVGSDDDPHAMALREFASRNAVPYRWLDRYDEAALAELSCELPATGAAVVTGRNDVLASPTARDLARAIGLDLRADTALCFDVLVVGAGPAGLAASVYAASEGLSVMVVEDTAIGGQQARRPGSRTTWDSRRASPARTSPTEE
jgi:thioredoxin reductase (NADPH)